MNTTEFNIVGIHNGNVFGIIFTNGYPCQWYGGLLKESKFAGYFPAFTGSGHVLTKEEALQHAVENFKFHVKQESYELRNIAREFKINKIRH